MISGAVTIWAAKCRDIATHVCRSLDVAQDETRSELAHKPAVLGRLATAGHRWLDVTACGTVEGGMGEGVPNTGLEGRPTTTGRVPRKEL